MTDGHVEEVVRISRGSSRPSPAQSTPMVKSRGSSRGSNTRGLSRQSSIAPSIQEENAQAEYETPLPQDRRPSTQSNKTPVREVSPRISGFGALEIVSDLKRSIESTGISEAGDQQDDESSSSNSDEESRTDSLTTTSGQKSRGDSGSVQENRRSSQQSGETALSEGNTEQDEGGEEGEGASDYDYESSEVSLVQGPQEERVTTAEKRMQELNELLEARLGPLATEDPNSVTVDPVAVLPKRAGRRQSLAGSIASTFDGAEIETIRLRRRTSKESIQFTQDDLHRLQLMFRLVSKGVQAHNRGHFAKALDLYTRVICEGPEDVMMNAFQSRGECHVALRNYKEAIEDFDKALTYKSDNTDILVHRAHAYKMSGQEDLALSELTTAIRLNSVNHLALNNRGVIYSDREMFDHALYDFERAVKLRPNFAHAYNNMGRTYNAMGQTTNAIDALNNAIKADPSMAPAYVNRGIAYEQAGDFDAARANYALAIKYNANL